MTPEQLQQLRLLMQAGGMSAALPQDQSQGSDGSYEVQMEQLRNMLQSAGRVPLVRAGLFGRGSLGNALGQESWGGRVQSQ